MSRSAIALNTELINIVIPEVFIGNDEGGALGTNVSDNSWA